VSMDVESENIDEIERLTVERAGDWLNEHIVVTCRVCDAVGLTIGSAPGGPFGQASLSRRVATNLMVRLSNDLRCVMLLAVRGYPLQAASLVSSLWEVSHMIAYIGGDDGRAQAWAAHVDPARSFRGARVLTTQVVESLEGVEDAPGLVGRAYKVYQDFCQAKHSNPLLQQHFGHHLTDEFVVASTGPDDESEAARPLTRESLKKGAQLTLIGVASFMDNHAPDARTRLQSTFAEIRTTLGSL
jgi:hypothetical protein